MTDDEDGSDMPQTEATMLGIDDAANARAESTTVAMLVVGMHRSGTSAVTRVLNLVGCEGPRSVIEGDQFNERGYWETADIAALNDDLLASEGSSWHDWTEAKQPWRTSANRPAFDARADQLLRQHFSGRSLFVMKDPRFCRLLPFWQDALGRFGADVRVVLPIRHPVEVTASLVRRDRFTPSIAQLIWLRNVLDAERYSRGLARAFVRYDDLLQDWRGVVRRVSDELGVDRLADTEGSGAEVDQFLSQSLRHHTVASEGTLLDLSPVPAPIFAETFAILSAPERTPRDLARLDDLRDRLDAASDLFQQPVRAVEAHARWLKARLDTATAEAATHKAEVEQGRAREEGLGARLAAATAEVEQGRAREEGLRARVAALEKQEKEARDQGLALQLVLSELRAVQRATAEEAEELLAGYLKLRRQLGRRRQEADRLAAELAAERRALQEIQRSASWRVTSPYRRIRGWLA